MCGSANLCDCLSSSDKLWYCRLSPNHKMLHYGDVEEDTDNPPIETLQEKSELKLGKCKDLRLLCIYLNELNLIFSLFSSSLSSSSRYQRLADGKRLSSHEGEQRQTEQGQQHSSSFQILLMFASRWLTVNISLCLYMHCRRCWTWHLASHTT